jgi:type I restriction enzyme M protein
MNQAVHNKLVSFIWSIADDCLRDVYVRGKYRDVILPMVVLRRLDALLEPTKDAVAEEVKEQIEIFGVDAQSWEKDALIEASGYVFYNTSKWTLNKIQKVATNNQQIIVANLTEYINGFSENVKEIIDKFNLRSQIAHMANKDVLLSVLEKFTSENINLTPFETTDSEGRKLPPLSNLGMGYVFEELIRKFNEENNEEAGEHFTPREVIDLMTHLVFDPIQDNLPPVITIYDPACGSGGMLTEAQNFIIEKYEVTEEDKSIHLYGKEINDETYAICKSDMMIKGNSPENIKNGSTLSSDEFQGTTFNFMLSNPPYGKSWASEAKYIKNGKDVIDTRFEVKLTDYFGESQTEAATPRSSDGQLLFLMEMVSKMKTLDQSPTGSRIASVHNGSSLFTGDAGSGESNIRRFIIENDMLEAIIQMPNNLFYNTGITTYIWLLSNHKKANRKGKVQLIDAGQLYRKLRKNLGQKNCEFAPEHIAEIMETHQQLATAERTTDNGIAAQVFDNTDFGYYKVTIERPKRLKAQFSAERIATLRYDSRLSDAMLWAVSEFGEAVYSDVTPFAKAILKWCEDNELNLNSKSRNDLKNPKFWKKQDDLFQNAKTLMQLIGTDEYDDFNVFSKKIDDVVRQGHALALPKLSNSEKNQIYNAITWYDADAAIVLGKKVKFKADKLAELLKRVGQGHALALQDYGYYPTGKPNEYQTYETQSDLRDTENVPLKQNIYDYFKTEVQPHVGEAWINLENTKIGYEISFNKYFYRHEPLRTLEAVSTDILHLENESDGLIKEILGL